MDIYQIVRLWAAHSPTSCGREMPPGVMGKEYEESEAIEQARLSYFQRRGDTNVKK